MNGLVVFALAFVVVGVSVVALSIGVIFHKRTPLKGSCHAAGRHGGSAACACHASHRRSAAAQAVRLGVISPGTGSRSPLRR